MDLKESMLWTDSTTVLRYIDNDGARFKTFVANRVSAFRENTRPAQWKYVNTASNPADQASRGLNAEQSYQEFSREISEDDADVKRTTSVNIIKTVDSSTDPLFKLTHHYSDWHSLKKAVAWM